MTRFFVSCIFCGRSCWIRGNGATCTDCGVYAHRRFGGPRWTVYLPTSMVPCQPTLKWETLEVTFCTPNPARLRAMLGDEQYDEYFPTRS